jgi:hypothetical protein
VLDSRNATLPVGGLAPHPNSIRRSVASSISATRIASLSNRNGVNAELDALPVDVLQMRIVAEVEKRMDLKEMR